MQESGYGRQKASGFNGFFTLAPLFAIAAALVVAGIMLVNLREQ